MKAQILVLPALLAAAILTGCEEEPPLEPFRVTETSPADLEVLVPRDVRPVVRFSHPPDPGSLSGNIHFVRNTWWCWWIWPRRPSWVEVPVTLRVDGTAVIVTPVTPLIPWGEYGIGVGPGVKDVHGRSLTEPLAVLFTPAASGNFALLNNPGGAIPE
ncbi:MAG: Ig-like domain-containing domain [Planctomycetota bacterium]|jgi:hypothetical protein